MDRLSECALFMAACKALAPKLGVGPESMRGWVVRDPAHRDDAAVRSAADDFADLDTPRLAGRGCRDRAIGDALDTEQRIPRVPAANGTRHRVIQVQAYFRY